MSSLATNAITDASGGNTTTINGYTPTVSNMAGRNRIINGSMVFDQRNAGASVTTSSGEDVYSLDRWQLIYSQTDKFTVQRNSGSVTPPAGLSNYIGAVSTSAFSIGSGDYFGIRQNIEGYNMADLAWGTADAKPVTISFWVRSSLTGTFGGALQTSGSTYFYAFSYTINSANTWEYKTVTISGPTSGTWSTDNQAGIRLTFSIAVGTTYSVSAGSWSATAALSVTGNTSVVGTSGATFYITGVQLEAGSVATPFEHRQYGQELALCQRYYFLAGGSVRLYADTIGAYCSTVPPVTPRATPTMTLPTAGTGNGILLVGANGTNGIYTLIKTPSGTSLVNIDSYTMAGSAEL
jgi:hypothetical protein